MASNTKWHALPGADVLKRLQTSEEGITQEEAKQRLKTYGPNKLPEGKTKSLFVIFLEQFKSPLIYILFVAAVIVTLLGEYLDAVFILFVISFNSVVGTIQEGKAQNTLLALRKFTETSADLRRSGEDIIVHDADVVPGDVVILQEGDKVPADARLIQMHNLRVNEAALTGESEPVSKTADVIPKEQATTAEQKNMVFKGTYVVAGNALAVVTGTGLETVIGKISKQITGINTEIPLQKDIRYFSRVVVVVVLVLVACVFALGFLFGKGLVEMFLITVTLAVSVIPEGLPVVITLLLSSGVWRMSKRHVLVKNLQAVEALGEARVIAVDKTGTITKGELVVQKVYAAGAEYEVSGIGYDPKGEIQHDGTAVNVASSPILVRLAKLGAMSSSADLSFDKESGSWNVSGDPTEAALLVFAQKAGITKEELARDHRKLAEIPFDSKKKYHAALHASAGGEIIAVTGAPEVMLQLSGSYLASEGEQPLTAEKRDELMAVFEHMSKQALRVIACAVKETTEKQLNDTTIRGLTFVGFFGMKDALREEVHEAMIRTENAGVRVVMITGDHEITAEAIAREAGIYHDGDEVLTDKEIDAMTNEELAAILEKTTVFARITPEHKLKIVEGYRLRGEVVAMTGDGVNDALSLVAADLGVAMGNKGTAVAKEAADLVLLDDNFGSIVSAIEEGRNIYKNIKKVILYLFSSSIGEVLVIVSSIVLGYPLPLFAAQLLWLNVVTDGFLDIALVMEPKEKNLLREKFVKPKKWIIDGWMVQRMAIMSTTMAIGSMIVFDHYLETQGLEKAMTMALNIMAVFQWFKAWTCRSEHGSLFSLNPVGNKPLVAATFTIVFLQLGALHLPFMQTVLRTVPLSVGDWVITIAVSTSVLIADELRKWIYRRWQAPKFYALKPQQSTQ